MYVLALASCRNFFEKTLLKVTEMRPRGKWGYYIYPKVQLPGRFEGLQTRILRLGKTVSAGESFYNKDQFVCLRHAEVFDFDLTNSCLTSI